MPAQRKVSFGRINRRDPLQEIMGMRDFATDMQALADSRQTSFVQKASNKQPMRRWTAADLEITPDGHV